MAGKGKKLTNKTKTEQKTPSTQRFRIEKMKKLQKAESAYLIIYPVCPAV